MARRVGFLRLKKKGWRDCNLRYYHDDHGHHHHHLEGAGMRTTESLNRSLARLQSTMRLCISNSMCEFEGGSDETTTTMNRLNGNSRYSSTRMS